MDKLVDVLSDDGQDGSVAVSQFLVSGGQVDPLLDPIIGIEMLKRGEESSSRAVQILPVEVGVLGQLVKFERISGDGSLEFAAVPAGGLGKLLQVDVELRNFFGYFILNQRIQVLSTSTAHCLLDLFEEGLVQLVLRSGSLVDFQAAPEALDLSF